MFFFQQSVVLPEVVMASRISQYQACGRHSTCHPATHMSFMHILRGSCCWCMCGALARCMDSYIYTMCAQKLNMRDNCTPYATRTKDNARHGLTYFATWKAGQMLQVVPTTRLLVPVGRSPCPVGASQSSQCCKLPGPQAAAHKYKGQWQTCLCHLCVPQFALELCPCWCTNQRPATPPAPDQMGSAQVQPGLP